MWNSSRLGPLSYDLEKVFAICFTDQCLARFKQSFSLFPKKLLIWTGNSSIAQSHYCISNDVKAKLSRKFHGEMTLFASAFAKPMKIRARLFLFNKPIKCFTFLFAFCFYVYFSRSYESHSIYLEFSPDTRLVSRIFTNSCSLCCTNEFKLFRL